MTRSPGEVPERAYGISMTTISDKMAARGVGALTDRELLTLLTEDGQRADALDYYPALKDQFVYS